MRGTWTCTSTTACPMDRFPLFPSGSLSPDPVNSTRPAQSPLIYSHSGMPLGPARLPQASSPPSSSHWWFSEVMFHQDRPSNAFPGPVAPNHLPRANDFPNVDAQQPCRDYGPPPSCPPRTYPTHSGPSALTSYSTPRSLHRMNWRVVRRLGPLSLRSPLTYYLDRQARDILTVRLEMAIWSCPLLIICTESEGSGQDRWSWLGDRPCLELLEVL